MRGRGGRDFPAHHVAVQALLDPQVSEAQRPCVYMIVLCVSDWVLTTTVVYQGTSIYMHIYRYTYLNK